jgi:hypothetical protein
MSRNLSTRNSQNTYQNDVADQLFFMQVIEIGKPNTTPTAREVQSMHKKRTYANAVVLPDGKVLVNGGTDLCKVFSDTGAVFQPGILLPRHLPCRTLEQKIT